VRLEDTLVVCNLCNTYNSQIKCNLITVCLHINLKVHVACNLSFVVKNEGVIQVTDSHVHFKSGSVLQTFLDKDIEATVHKHEVICRKAI